MKTIWLFGPSGAGKTTVSNALTEIIGASVQIDGDQLRGGLCEDLGFSDTDRETQAKRAAHIAKIVAASGVVPIVSLITPHREFRKAVRDVLGGDVLMVYLRSTVDERVKRDPKGLYAQAMAAQLPFPLTGLDGRFDEPRMNESVYEIDTDTTSPEEAAQLIRGRYVD